MGERYFYNADGEMLGIRKEKMNKSVVKEPNCHLQPTGRKA